MPAQVVVNDRASIAASTRLPTEASSDAVLVVGAVELVEFEAWGLHSIWD